MPAVSKHGRAIIFVATGVPHIDPAWGAILGDFLTNLRAALDYFAWQLVILSGGEPNRQTMFPIRTPRKDGAPPKPVELAGVRPDLLAEIEALQPRTPDQLDDVPPENNGLYILNELVNIDKHRLLLVMAAQLSTTGAWWYVTNDGPGPTLRFTPGPLTAELSRPASTSSTARHRRP